MRSRRITLGVTAVLVPAAFACVALWMGLAPNRTLSAQESRQADEHDGHDHGKEEKHDERAAHDGGKHESEDHDRKASQGHDDHQDEGHEEEGKDAHEGHGHEEEDAGELSVRLSPEQMTRFGVTLAAAGPGTLQRQIRLPGEIVVNADRMAHVVPPAGGVAREVSVSVGGSVRAGQTMAVLESAELSEAKTRYLATLNELNCCSIDLTRAEALDASSGELVKALATSPTLDQLHSLKLPAMAEGHSKLIGAYAELVLARAEYEREKKLIAQDVSSRADFQTATSAYKKAFAEFVAGRDSLAFETRRAMLEARRSRQNVELELRAAARKLHILGVSPKEVKAVEASLRGGGAAEHDCDDPNCAECKTSGHGGHATAEKTTSHSTSGQQLGVYSLRAPFAGTVIAKHITLGEMLSNDAAVFTVADLTTVWVDLSVYQKDLAYVRRGQIVHIALGKKTSPVEGKIAFVSPIVDGETRTAKARIILANPKGVYRPGLFVTADVDVSATSVPVLLPKAAVQRIEDRDVVFVPTDEGLTAKPVRLGRSSRTHVEIVEGLRAGQKYVARGAFQLKAQIVTSGLGAHAGHGH